MTSTTPQPKGIPNKVGNGCWFASISQTIFRQETLRNSFNEFQAKGIKFDRQKDFELALDLLHKYFNDIADPNTEVSNEDLLHALPYNDNWLFRDERVGGKDSTTALLSFMQLFSSIAGDKKANIHTFGTPLADCLLITLNDNGKKLFVPKLQIENCECISDALKLELDHLAFLPHYLFLEASQKWPQYLKIEETFSVPEPIEYQVMDKDIDKCKSKVQYTLVSIIVYHGSDASHATAVVRGGVKGKWYHYNDSTVTPVNDLSAVFDNSKWPKVFLYEKI